MTRKSVAAIAVILLLQISLFHTPTWAQQATSTATLPHIIVLTTGGTIAGQASNRSAIGYQAGKLSGADLVAAVPGLDHLATVSVEQISSIGSQDMNDKVWFDLAKRIKEIFGKSEADGVVITHGTDTMEETAFFLSLVLSPDKPVVLVGSMRPSTAVSADGPGNLYEAVEVAASPRARGHGVLVVLNDTIHGARLVTKTNTTSVQTFTSPDGGPVGYVDPASIRFAMPVVAAARPPYALPAAPPLPRVDIIYAHANMDAALIDDAVKGGAKGLVLAGVGDGNGSQAAIDALANAVKQGVIVVRASRTGSGFVNRNVEVDDDKLGFAVALDLNPQKARVLCQLLIANGVTSPHDVQDAFAGTW
ncbi:MAG TPA: asparaginase [Acidisphaera sp.]|nr:asparaginase [Acidisphaera sp.]